MLRTSVCRDFYANVWCRFRNDKLFLLQLFHWNTNFFTACTTNPFGDNSDIRLHHFSETALFDMHFLKVSSIVPVDRRFIEFLQNLLPPICSIPADEMLFERRFLPVGFLVTNFFKSIPRDGSRCDFTAEASNTRRRA